VVFAGAISCVCDESGEMCNLLVDLSRVSHRIVRLGCAGGDFESGAWDHHVGGICATGPFLAVRAVTECGDCRLTLILICEVCWWFFSFRETSEGKKVANYI
jgi:hypothetical protein